MPSIRNALITGACIAAAAFGGSAIADAASSNNSSSTPSGSSSPQTSRPQPPPPRDPSQGGHRANGKAEELLSGDTAAKVKAAALDKVSGTVERVETDADHGSPYEAHVRKADGTEVEVLVNSDFNVTAVNQMGPRP